MIDIDIVKDNQIFIPEDKWTWLNNNYNKEEIKEFISNTIDKNSLPLPYTKITKEEAISDFEALKSLDTSSFFKKGSFFSRYDYEIDPSNIYIEGTNIGKDSSNFFHQRSRWLCDSINAPSPYRSWTIKKFRDGLLNSFWTLKFNKIGSSEIRTAISMRKYMASQFKPSVAKAIYDHFEAESVLDVCSGWGDRLSGFMASKNGKKYVGCDPNERLVDGYDMQIGEFGTNRDIDTYCCCSEDIDFGDNIFDISFTSPPYFIIERYTQEEDQSWRRYKKINEWLHNFLFIIVYKQIKSLKNGGILAINISDVYCNHTVNNICDPLIKFVLKTGMMSPVEYFGIRMAKRVNSNSDRSGVFCEPLFIWRKK